MHPFLASQIGWYEKLKGEFFTLDPIITRDNHPKPKPWDGCLFIYIHCALKKETQSSRIVFTLEKGTFLCDYVTLIYLHISCILCSQGKRQRTTQLARPSLKYKGGESMAVSANHINAVLRISGVDSDRHLTLNRVRTNLTSPNVTGLMEATMAIRNEQIGHVGMTVTTELARD